MKNNKLISNKENIVEKLKLPRDICLGDIRISLTGHQNVWIENYKGILEYTENRIILQGKNIKVCFEGDRLSIDYYTNEDMKISGNISCIKYL